LWLLVALAALLFSHGTLLEGAEAKKARKRPKETTPQHTEVFNTTLSNSEEEDETTKVNSFCLIFLSLFSHSVKLFPSPLILSFSGQPDSTVSGTSDRAKKKGPPGPPGPQGPPGAPGAEVTQEVLLKEFKEMIKEATERRALGDKASGHSQLPTTLLALEGMASYRRIEEAFHCKLKGPVVVDKKTLAELQNFQTPPAKGAFLRGTGMDQSTGRFTAPITGIYQFSANVHIDHSEVKKIKNQLRARDNVRVLICIESLCHRYTSLEMIVGLESNSKIFTVYVHGLLELQAGQYTSIFVDNAAGASITIQNGSDFMGMLLGV
ncbi:adipolin isoform X1, partial [Silurus meridionalis]